MKAITTTLLTAATLLCSTIQNVHAHGHEIPFKVGVQLWSVKDELKADFKGTIKQLAAMGFKGVELAGEYGEFKDDPEGLAAFIKSQGMEISGTHTGFDKLTDDKIDDTLSFYKRAGVTAAMISWDSRAFDPNTVWQTIADLNRLQAKVESYGIKFGYHNHAQEFGAYRDVTLWDHIARSTPDSMIMQLDVGWASAAGLNPADFVRKHPGRTVSTHFKAAENEVERGKLPIIGQDSINWHELIHASKSVGGTKWLILEQEEYPNGMSQLQAVEASKKGLDKVLGEMGLSEKEPPVTK